MPSYYPDEQEDEDSPVRASEHRKDLRRRKSERTSKSSSGDRHHRHHHHHHKSSRRTTSRREEEEEEDDASYGVEELARSQRESSRKHRSREPQESSQPRQPSRQREENIFTQSIPAPPLVGLADENSVQESNDEKDSKGQVAVEIHRALKESNWQRVYDILLLVRENEDEIYPVLSLAHKGGTTALHICVWKAPVALTKFIFDMVSSVSKQQFSSLCLARDDDGNTPLHLCCANLEAQPGSKKALDLSVLKQLVNGDPRALQVQNEQGDTPLHLLVSSPACTSTAGGSTLYAMEAAAEAAVTLLLDASPDAAIIQDVVDGSTPLHVAISHSAHERVVMRLLEMAPVASKVQDDRGFLPLHYVAAFHQSGSNSYGVSYAAVQLLVRAYPESISYKSVNGDTPLHIFISNMQKQEPSENEDARLDRNSTRVLELLMGMGRDDNESDDELFESGTSPVMIVNNEKLTPLHCCAVFDANPQVTKLIMKHPLAKNASAMPNMFGATALHLACAQQTVADSITNVVALGTREAAAVEDRLKRTPLHVAAQNVHATGQLIKVLCDLNPDATSLQTQRGHLPLHLAAQSKAKESVIKALVRAYPKATEARNKSSNTPLHDAAKYRASPGVVKLLLDAYPDAVYIQNQYGNLPLHCATAYQATPDVVQLLLEAWPDGAAIQNRNQDAPLHYAAAYASSAALVKPLIDAAPAAVLLLNSSGQSPIDRARINNAPDEIVELLEDSAEEWTKKAATDGWGAFSADFEGF